MPNQTINIPRAHLIMGLCLPLAVLIGYLVAEPMDSSTLGVLVLILAFLSVPILMKWYHPLLVFSINSAFVIGFLPGSLPLWVFVAMIGFVVAAVNRCIDPTRRLMVGGALPRTLICIGAVVALTALATGGAGLRALGSSSYGGKHYFNVVAAILVYFVLASHQVPLSRTNLYTAIFFLSGITSLASVLLAATGERFPLIYLFLPTTPISASSSGFTGAGLVRVMGLVGVANAVFMFSLSYFGVRGILDLTRPWRLALVAVSLAAGLYGGFRSFFGFILLVFILAFFLEGLHRTRYLLGAAVLAVLCSVGLLFFAAKLPLPVQRSLSFLPIQLHPAAKHDAQSSSEWRFEMWKNLLPDVPRYLFKGKGYALDPDDLFLSRENFLRGLSASADTFALTGDYHNGPLSVIIPFGIWGALAVTWFFVAAGRLFYVNYARGDPALKTINSLLLACFIARLFFFLFLVGGFETDLAYFASLAGLSVCLNGPVKERVSSHELVAVPEYGT